MEMEDFLKKLKSCKFTMKQTGLFNVKASRSVGDLSHYIYTDDKCRTCGHHSRRGITVKFFKPHEHLTIFQAEMLFAVYCLGRKPADYASYHKSQAGREFIGNIVEIREMIS